MRNHTAKIFCDTGQTLTLFGCARGIATGEHGGNHIAVQQPESPAPQIKGLIAARFHQQEDTVEAKCEQEDEVRRVHRAE